MALSPLSLSLSLSTQSLYKPFVKWVWWKRQLLTQFQSLYPSEFNNYFEPFVWWGAVFFDLRNKFWNKFKAYLFDINEELVNLYNVVKKDTDKLIKELKVFQENNTKDFYLLVRAWDREPDYMVKRSPIERAARFLYLNKTWYNWLRRVNSHWFNNVPYWKYINPRICDEEWLYAAKNALVNTTIKVSDFSKAVRNAKEFDFIYFDPPYDPLNKTSSFTDYTKGWFSDDDQRRLWNCFRELDERGCYVMASNNNTPLINDIYLWFEKELVSAKRAINSDGTKRWEIKEIVILSSKLG